MITVMIFATVKPDRVAAYKKMIPVLTNSAKARAGCITYRFNQRIDSPTEFVLYEQWQSQSALDAHIEGLS